MDLFPLFNSEISSHFVWTDNSERTQANERTIPCDRALGCVPYFRPPPKGVVYSARVWGVGLQETQQLAPVLPAPIAAATFGWGRGAGPHYHTAAPKGVNNTGTTFPLSLILPDRGNVVRWLSQGHSHLGRDPIEPDTSRPGPWMAPRRLAPPVPIAVKTRQRLREFREPAGEHTLRLSQRPCHRGQLTSDPTTLPVRTGCVKATC